MFVHHRKSSRERIIRAFCCCCSTVDDYSGTSSDRHASLEAVRDSSQQSVSRVVDVALSPIDEVAGAKPSAESTIS